MENPLISIIIPVYKAEKYLDECISSIVGQTYNNLEIILIDDGSPDSSGAICDRWAEKDSRITVIHIQNSGAAAARNIGLRVATGDYIGFVDSDDYIAETMYETMLEAMLNSGKKMAYCGAYRVTVNKGIVEMPSVQQQIEFDTEAAIKNLFYGKIDTAVWSKLFERSVFEGIFFPEGEINEEFPILIPLISKADGIICIDRLMYYYRENCNSVTSAWIFREKHCDIAYKNIAKMETQLIEYNIHAMEAFRYFSGFCAFSCAFPMEKYYTQLTSKGKQVYCLYRAMLKENVGVLMRSKYCSVKNKILCILLLTRMVRPVYKFFYRSHLN
jgi:glycosyltransferase involved in cell wall biosynthesis